jgi:hypothetical protein
MADLYTKNTFAEYSSLAEVIQNGWRGLNLAKCLELFELLDHEVAKNLALYKCVKLAQLVGLPPETNIVKFEFKEYVNERTAYPVIRQLDGEYVIQMDNEAIPLMKYREQFQIVPDVQKITTGAETYELPNFVFTLPEEETATDGFAVKSTFALKVDATRKADKTSTNNDDLVALFRMNAGSPTTMSLVEEFKENSGFTLLRDLQPGLYPFKSYEMKEQTAIDNGKTKKWKVVLLNCVDGTSINVNLNSTIGKLFDGALAQASLNAAIKKNGFCTLFIREVETVERKDGSVVHPVHGNVFNGNAPANLKVMFSPENVALRSAQTPSLSASVPAQSTVPAQSQTVTVPAQSTPVEAAAKATRAKKTNPDITANIKPLSDDEAPDFGELMD